MGYPNKNIQINKWTTEGKKKKKLIEDKSRVNLHRKREREREGKSESIAQFEFNS